MLKRNCVKNKHFSKAQDYFTSIAGDDSFWPVPIIHTFCYFRIKKSQPSAISGIPPFISLYIFFHLIGMVKTEGWLSKNLFL